MHITPRCDAIRQKNGVGNYDCALVKCTDGQGPSAHQELLTCGVSSGRRTAVLRTEPAVHYPSKHAGVRKGINKKLEHTRRLADAGTARTA